MDISEILWALIIIAVIPLAADMIFTGMDTLRAASDGIPYYEMKK